MHKQIEHDLVKRSSLAQSLIKQLNKRLKEVEYRQGLNNLSESGIKSGSERSQDSSRMSSSSKVSSMRERQLEEEYNKLKF